MFVGNKMTIKKLFEIYGEQNICVMDKNNKVVEYTQDTEIKKYFMFDNSQWIVYKK